MRVRPSDRAPFAFHPSGSGRLMRSGPFGGMSFSDFVLLPVPAVQQERYRSVLFPDVRAGTLHSSHSWSD